MRLQPDLLIHSPGARDKYWCRYHTCLLNKKLKSAASRLSIKTENWICSFLFSYVWVASLVFMNAFSGTNQFVGHSCPVGCSCAEKSCRRRAPLLQLLSEVTDSFHHAVPFAPLVPCAALIQITVAPRIMDKKSSSIKAIFGFSAPAIRWPIVLNHICSYNQ